MHIERKSGVKYVDEFRDKGLVRQIAARIGAMMPAKKNNIMEVCGTHTQSFFRFGLDKLLPPNLRLIAGPGCPVCVSSQGYIDQAIALAKDKGNIILTFADMLRVPGTKSTLEKERARGSRIQAAYSALDSLAVARMNRAKRIIFLAVGFETTAPTIALSIIAAKKEKLKNLYFFSSLKLIPPAMDYLLKDKRLNINGFLCPGHVSVIIGSQAYEQISKRYGIGCCVAGFEPLDILEGIEVLLKQIAQARPAVANQYLRAVKRQGNPRARKVISEVFQVSNASWRGLGNIARSGLKIKDKYSRFDAEEAFSFKITVDDQRLTTKCRCGDVLKGLISPADCPLFLKACQPDNPVGPCMVSSEGACNAYYKYH